ncbi:hypothetical protein DI272_01230 [Streptomyces sp. Act143]|uniref:hypothetical protein n=1 Tax=Streptomyces sp. Act143 TaxID=2200760 RepID=UPI000D67DCDE|nr:hypothetical protein [Streptomyces sp. Act143]PWI12920.1 hypothetical protein DI272_01230 [Streptomyces sp. Act143]
MSRVLGLGIALVTASGCVWYLPALIDLRAGADRPVSRRTAAMACLTGWSAAGSVALLFLAGARWPVPCAAAVAGAAGTTVLRLRARAQHRCEAREVARHWAALEPVPPRHGRPRGRPERAFAALVACGVAVALLAEALLMVAGPDEGWGRPAVTVVPAAVLGVFLLLAATYAHGRPRRARPDAVPGPSGPSGPQAGTTGPSPRGPRAPTL